MPSKRDLITSVLIRSGAASLLQKAMPWKGVITLNYHRIGDGSTSLFDRGLWSAIPEIFERQILFAKKNFDIISPADLPEVLKKKRGRHCLITFDDGYLDNFNTAFPVLKVHHVPATFFIATGFIDNAPLPWWDEIAWMTRTTKKAELEIPPWIEETIILDNPDRERAVRTLLKAYKEMPAKRTGDYLDSIAKATRTGRATAAHAANTWMTWQNIRDMQKAGMTIGGHTVHHPILARMTDEAQWEEISGCAQRIQQELNQPMTTFSYPVGHTDAFNAVTRECLEKAGVQYAFSYYGGIAKFRRWDNLDIRRLPIDNDLSFDHFRAILTLPKLFARPEFAD